MKTHLFQPDHSLTIDGRGEHPCSTCGLPQQHRSHDVPELPPEAAEIDARILGETNE